MSRTAMLLTLFLLGAGAGAVAGPAAPPADAAAACRDLGRDVARTSQSRIVRRGSDYFGCTRSVGRYFPLNRADSTLEEATLAVAGPFAAFESQPLDLDAFEVIVRDLRTGKVARRATSNVRGSDLGASGPAGMIVLSSSGAVAWLACENGRAEGSECGDIELHAITSTSRRRRVLDRGAIRSLRLRGTELSWRNAGRPVSRTLR